MEDLKNSFFVFLELLMEISKKRHFRLEIASLAVLTRNDREKSLRDLSRPKQSRLAGIEYDLVRSKVLLIMPLQGVIDEDRDVSRSAVYR